MAEYSIYSEFDIEKHKATFYDYLEVIIDANGKVMYAVPCHQQKASFLACEELDCTMQELSAMCPSAYYFDYLNWVLEITGSIALWKDQYQAPVINKKQIAVMKKLKLAGIYTGPIPKKS